MPDTPQTVVAAFRVKGLQLVPTLTLSAENQQRFESFLRHRRLNDRALELLKKAKESHDLKRGELQVAQNLTYPAIAENLLKAVNSGWLPVDQLITMLDESELAGKQHVCVYHLPKKGASKVIDALRNPTGRKGGKPRIDDFLSVPAHSTVRILLDTPDAVAVKIVTKRAYWTLNLLEDEPERKVVEKLLQRERSAIIVAADTESNLLQIRVPPREKGPVETGKAVHDFMIKALEEHFDLGAGSWLQKLVHFPISDAFKKILKNETDFILWYDTPENHTTRTRIARKGRPTDDADLRKDKTWQFRDGFSRPTIRGFWKCESKNKVYVHMNADVVKVNQNTTRSFARIFVPDLCCNEDLNDVVCKIRDHL